MDLVIFLRTGKKHFLGSNLSCLHSYKYRVLTWIEVTRHIREINQDFLLFLGSSSWRNVFEALGRLGRYTENGGRDDRDLVLSSPRQRIQYLHADEGRRKKEQFMKS